MPDIKVTYEQPKQIIIHGIFKADNPEHLVHTSFVGSQPGAKLILRWADGIVFNITSYAQTESITKEMIAGTIHWSHVSFAQMPTFQPQITSNQITCIVVDVTKNDAFKVLARFLKSN